MPKARESRVGADSIRLHTAVRKNRRSSYTSQSDVANIRSALGIPLLTAGTKQ